MIIKYSLRKNDINFYSPIRGGKKDITVPKQFRFLLNNRILNSLILSLGSSYVEFYMKIVQDLDDNTSNLKLLKMPNNNSLKLDVKEGYFGDFNTINFDENQLVKYGYKKNKNNYIFLQLEVTEVFNNKITTKNSLILKKELKPSPPNEPIDLKGINEIKFQNIYNISGKISDLKNNIIDNDLSINLYKNDDIFLKKNIDLIDGNYNVLIPEGEYKLSIISKNKNLDQRFYMETFADGKNSLEQSDPILVDKDLNIDFVLIVKQVVSISGKVSSDEKVIDNVKFNFYNLNNKLVEPDYFNYDKSNGDYKIKITPNEYYFNCQGDDENGTIYKPLYYENTYIRKNADKVNFEVDNNNNLPDINNIKYDLNNIKDEIQKESRLEVMTLTCRIKINDSYVTNGNLVAFREDNKQISQIFELVDLNNAYFFTGTLFNGSDNCYFVYYDINNIATKLDEKIDFIDKSQIGDLISPKELSGNINYGNYNYNFDLKPEIDYNLQLEDQKLKKGFITFNVNAIIEIYYDDYESLDPLYLFSAKESQKYQLLLGKYKIRIIPDDSKYKIKYFDSESWDNAEVIYIEDNNNFDNPYQLTFTLEEQDKRKISGKFKNYSKKSEFAIILYDKDFLIEYNFNYSVDNDSYQINLLPGDYYFNVISVDGVYKVYMSELISISDSDIELFNIDLEERPSTIIKVICDFKLLTPEKTILTIIKDPYESLLVTEEIDENNEFKLNIPKDLLKDLDYLDLNFETANYIGDFEQESDSSLIVTFSQKNIIFNYGGEGSISGVISSKDDSKPISNLKLVVLSQDETIFEESMTNSEGEYKFDNLPINRQYYLANSYNDKNLYRDENSIFESIRITFDFKDSINVEKDISLNKNNVFGYLLDTNSEVVKDIQISISNDIYQYNTLTDHNGYYTFYVPNKDTYKISYEEWTKLESKELKINNSLFLGSKIVNNPMKKLEVIVEYDSSNFTVNDILTNKTVYFDNKDIVNLNSGIFNVRIDSNNSDVYYKDYSKTIEFFTELKINKIELIESNKALIELNSNHIYKIGDTIQISDTDNYNGDFIINEIVNKKKINITSPSFIGKNYNKEFKGTAELYEHKILKFESTDKTVTLTGSVDQTEYTISLHNRNIGFFKLRQNYGDSSDFSIKVVPGNYVLEIKSDRYRYKTNVIIYEDTYLGSIELMEELMIVDGLIKDNKGNILPNINVLAIDNDGNSFNSITDENGNYELELIYGKWQIFANTYNNNFDMSVYKNIQVFNSDITVDFTINKLEHTISGNFLDEDNKFIEYDRGTLYVTDKEGNKVTETYIKDSLFNFKLNEGTYNLNYKSNKYYLENTEQITVTDSNINDLKITLLKSNNSFTGFIKNKNLAVSNIEGDIYLYNNDVYKVAEINSVNGKFIFTNLRPGDYFLDYKLSENNNYITKPSNEIVVTIDKNSFRDINLETLNRTTISGMINKNNKLNEHFNVILTKINDPLFYKLTKTNSNNEFTFDIPISSKFEFYEISVNLVNNDRYIEPESQIIRIKDLPKDDIELKLIEDFNFYVGNVKVKDTTTTFENIFVNAYTKKNQSVLVKTDAEGYFNINLSTGIWYFEAYYDDLNVKYKTNEPLEINIPSEEEINLEMSLIKYKLPDVVYRDIISEYETVVELKDGTILEFPKNFYEKNLKLIVRPIVRNLQNSFSSKPTNYGYSFQLIDSENNDFKGNFNKSVKLIIPYEDSTLDEDKINLSYFNSANKQWERISNFVIDKDNNKIIGFLNRFSSWSIFELKDINYEPVKDIIQVILPAIYEDSNTIIYSSKLLENIFDPEGKRLTITEIIPSSGIVSQSGNNWEYETENNFNGEVVFNYKVTDGVNTINSKALLNILPINDFPVLQDVKLEDIQEDNQLEIITENLITEAIKENVDNIPLTLQSITVRNDIGVIEKQDNNWIFKPKDNWHGNVDLEFNIINELLDISIFKNASLNVISVDDILNVENVQLEDIKEDFVLLITQESLLENSSDIDDTMTVTKLELTDENLGSLVYNQNNESWSYNPKKDYFGQVDFEFEVANSRGIKKSANATLKIISVDDKPVISGILNLGEIDENTQLNTTYSKFLNNVVDPDDDLFTIKINSFTNSTFESDGQNVIFYPDKNFNGKISINYSVISNGYEVGAFAEITVKPVQSQPEVKTFVELGSISEIQIKKIKTETLLSEAKDPDGDPLKIINLTADVGNLDGPDKNGDYTYTPDVITFIENQLNEYFVEFIYNITDDKTAPVPAQAYLTVYPFNRKPDYKGRLNLGKINEDNELKISKNDLLNNVIDIQNENLTINNIKIKSGSAELTEEVNDITIKPKGNWSGEIILQYLVNDSKYTIVAEAILIVSPVDDKAVIEDVNLGTLNEDNILIITSEMLLKNSYDVDNKLEISEVKLSDSNSSNGKIVKQGNKWIFTPKEHFYGSIVIDFIVGSQSAIAFLEIKSVNDLPIQSEVVKLNPIKENETLTLTKEKLLENTTDYDNQKETLTIKSYKLQPEDIGSIINNIFTPSKYGDVTLNYKVSDGQSEMLHKAEFSIQPIIRGNNIINLEDKIMPVTLTRSELLSGIELIAGQEFDFKDFSSNLGNIKKEDNNWILDSFAGTGEIKIEYTITDNYNNEKIMNLNFGIINEVNEYKFDDLKLNDFDLEIKEDKVLNLNDIDILQRIDSSIKFPNNLSVTNVKSSLEKSSIERIDNFWKYTPELNYYGEDTLTISISDNNLNKYVNVEINILPLVDKPTLNILTDKISVFEGNLAKLDFSIESIEENNFLEIDNLPLAAKIVNEEGVDIENILSTDNGLKKVRIDNNSEPHIVVNNILPIFNIYLNAVAKLDNSENKSELKAITITVIKSAKKAKLEEENIIINEDENALLSDYLNIITQALEEIEIEIELNDDNGELLLNNSSITKTGNTYKLNSLDNIYYKPPNDKSGNFTFNLKVITKILNNGKESKKDFSKDILITVNSIADTPVFQLGDDFSNNIIVDEGGKFNLNINNITVKDNEKLNLFIKEVDNKPFTLNKGFLKDEKYIITKKDLEGLQVTLEKNNYSYNFLVTAEAVQDTSKTVKSENILVAINRIPEKPKLIVNDIEIDQTYSDTYLIKIEDYITFGRLDEDNLDDYISIEIANLPKKIDIVQNTEDGLVVLEKSNNSFSIFDTITGYYFQTVTGYNTYNSESDSINLILKAKSASGTEVSLIEKKLNIKIKPEDIIGTINQIIGLPIVGEKLMPGEVVDSNGTLNSTFNYTWQISDNKINWTDLKNTESITLEKNSIGKYIRVRVSYTDDNRFENDINSEFIGPIIKDLSFMFALETDKFEYGEILNNKWIEDNFKLTIFNGSTYSTDYSYSVKDNESKILSLPIEKINQSLNTDYTITFTHLNSSVEKVIRIIDTIPPVINFDKSNSFLFNENDGVINLIDCINIVDNDDNLTTTISVNGNEQTTLNTTSPGNYNVIYSVEDSSKNKSSFETVFKVENPDPANIVIENKITEVNIGTLFKLDNFVDNEYFSITAFKNNLPNKFENLILDDTNLEIELEYYGKEVNLDKTLYLNLNSSLKITVRVTNYNVESVKTFSIDVINNIKPIIETKIPNRLYVVPNILTFDPLNLINIKNYSYNIDIVYSEDEKFIEKYSFGRTLTGFLDSEQNLNIRNKLSCIIYKVDLNSNNLEEIGILNEDNLNNIKQNSGNYQLQFELEDDYGNSTINYIDILIGQSLKGLAQDGYLKNALVEAIDVDSQLVIATTLTNDYGNWFFTNDELEPNRYYRIEISGGIDISTGKNNLNTFKSLGQSSGDGISSADLNVNPISTLIAEDITKNYTQGENIVDIVNNSVETISDNLDIPDSVNILEENILEKTKDNDANSLNIMKNNYKIVCLLSIMNSLSTNQSPNNNLQVESIVSANLKNDSLNFNSNDSIKNVVNQINSQDNLGIDNTQIEKIVLVIRNFVDNIISSVNIEELTKITGVINNLSSEITTAENLELILTIIDDYSSVDNIEKAKNDIVIGTIFYPSPSINFEKPSHIELTKDNLTKNSIINLLQINTDDGEGNDITQTILISAEDEKGKIYGSELIDSNGINLIENEVNSLKIVLSLTNKYDNSVEESIDIDILDTIPPVIDLVGGDEINLEFKSFYVELGYSANDEVDGNVEVQISNDINSNSLGRYKVIYLAEDSSGNKSSKTRIVNVVDSIGPEIEILYRDGSILDQFQNLIVEAGSEFIIPEVRINDEHDGEIDDYSTIIEVDNEIINKINTNLLKEYKITYFASDSSNNTTTKELKVIIVDTIAPEINLIGNESIIHQIGDEYNDLGAFAKDVIDGFSKPEIISNEININKIGSYLLQYQAIDSSGNERTKSRNVEIKHLLNPSLVLEGRSNIVLEAGSNFTDPGASATDSVGNEIDVSKFITNSNSDNLDNIDTNLPDTYLIFYSAKDESNNTTIETRTVEIRDTTPPISTYTGDNIINIEVNSPEDEFTYEVEFNDTVDGIILIYPKIYLNDQEVQKMNFNDLNSYKLIYNATDSSGNKSDDLEITVNIVDNKAPTIVISNKEVTHEAGYEYTDEEVVITDNFDDQVTLLKTVISPNELEFSYEDEIILDQLGEYRLVYLAKDSYGNIAEETKIINVVDTEKPYSIYTGDTVFNLSIDDEFNFPNVKFDDKAEGIIELLTPVEIFKVINENKVKVNEFNTKDYSVFKLIYNATDSSGNKSDDLEITVYIKDSISPIITFDPLIINHEAGKVFNDIGLTVQDESGVLTINKFIKLNDGEYLPFEDGKILGIGDYIIKYEAIDNTGNVSIKERELKSKDTLPPVIDYTGANNFEVKLNDEFLPPKIKFVDLVDGEILVETNSVFDLEIPGSYTLTYQAIDSSGNKSEEFEIELVVIDQPPEIILIDPIGVDKDESGAFIYNLNSIYNDAGVTVTDDFDKLIEISKIEIEDPDGLINNLTPDFNLDKVGTYTITFQAVDSSGNESSVIRKLSVIEIEKEVEIEIENIGWNFISFPLIAEDMSPKILLGDYLANVNEIKGLDDFFNPEFPDIVNTLKEFNIKNAYWLKLKQKENIKYSGQLQDKVSIDLKPNNWSFVGTPLREEINIESFVESINGYDYEIKTVSSFYNPKYNQFVNTLKTVSPGEGLFIYLNNDDSISLEIDNTKVKRSKKKRSRRRSRGNNNDPFGTPITYPTLPANIIGRLKEIEINIGDTIAGYVNGELRGKFVFDSKNELFNINLSAKSYLIGEKVKFKLYKPSKEKVYDLQSNNNDIARISPSSIVEEKYNLELRVTDSSPKINLIGEKVVNLNYLDNYIELGANAFDSNNFSLDVQITNNVNTAKIGTYLVTYTAFDNLGNSSSVTRTVIVKDNTPPEITLNGNKVIFISHGDQYVERGAFARDKNGVSLQVFKEGTVNSNKVGSYNIKYTATDSNGNSSYVTRLVNVNDQSPPVITLKGDKNISIQKNSNFIDPGATAFDAVDGNVQVSTSGFVNTFQTGNYTLKYSAIDKAGNNSIKFRYITVFDNTPPQISLIGNSLVVLELNDNYNELGANASDNTGKSLNVQRNGSVNTKKAGDYKIIYSATDSNGRTSSVQRVVRIINNQPPTITLNGQSEIILDLNSSYIERGAIAIDNKGNPINVDIINNVNIEAVGIYTVTYIATDNENRSSSEIRIVNVISNDGSGNNGSNDGSGNNGSNDGSGNNGSGNNGSNNGSGNNGSGNNGSDNGSGNNGSGNNGSDNGSGNNGSGNNGSDDGSGNNGSNNGSGNNGSNNGSGDNGSNNNGSDNGSGDNGSNNNGSDNGSGNNGSGNNGSNNGSGNNGSGNNGSNNGSGDNGSGNNGSNNGSGDNGSGNNGSDNGSGNNGSDNGSGNNDSTDELSGKNLILIGNYESIDYNKVTDQEKTLLNSKLTTRAVNILDVTPESVSVSFKSGSFIAEIFINIFTTVTKQNSRDIFKLGMKDTYDLLPKSFELGKYCVMDEDLTIILTNKDNLDKSCEDTNVLPGNWFYNPDAGVCEDPHIMTFGDSRVDLPERECEYNMLKFKELNINMTTQIINHGCYAKMFLIEYKNNKIKIDIDKLEIDGKRLSEINNIYKNFIIRKLNSNNLEIRTKNEDFKFLFNKKKRGMLMKSRENIDQESGSGVFMANDINSCIINKY